MGTGSNFYKNPAFIYDNQSKLSSALDNLRAYNLATRNFSGKDLNAHENQQEGDADACRKRKRNNNFPENNSRHNDRILFKTETLDHEQYKAKLRKEAGASPVFEDSNPNAASTVGFDPYEKKSEIKRFGKVEVLCNESGSSLLQLYTGGHNSAAEDEATCNKTVEVQEAAEEIVRPMQVGVRRIAQKELISAFQHLESLYVLCVADMVNIFVMRQMMMYAVWNVNASYYSCMLRIAPRKPRKLEPHLFHGEDQRVHCNFLRWKQILGMLQKIDGQREEVACLHLNAGNVDDQVTYQMIV